MNDQELKPLVIAVRLCEEPLRDVLRTYEEVHRLVENEQPVIKALAAAAGPLQNALAALRNVQASSPAKMARIARLETAVNGAARVQAMLDAIEPLRGALNACGKLLDHWGVPQLTPHQG
jgi:hypothetical protein